MIPIIINSILNSLFIQLEKVKKKRNMFALFFPKRKTMSSKLSDNINSFFAAISQKLRRACPLFTHCTWQHWITVNYGNTNCEIWTNVSRFSGLSGGIFWTCECAVRLKLPLCGFWLRFYRAWITFEMVKY